MLLFYSQNPPNIKKIKGIKSVSANMFLSINFSSSFWPMSLQNEFIHTNTHHMGTGTN